MTGVLDKYLEAHGLTRYRLAKESGISQSTWARANSHTLDHWTVKQVRALASTTGLSAATVLRELEGLEDAQA